MKKIESRGNNESSASVCHAQRKKDSLAGRRVRILNFSRQVVANDILMSNDNDNVVMGKKLGGEYYEHGFIQSNDGDQKSNKENFEQEFEQNCKQQVDMEIDGYISEQGPPAQGIMIDEIDSQPNQLEKEVDNPKAK
ncbi:hypothetical protein Taro_033870 [Colocasia esculenta]|uniref:Uncharacterized protein n=1 Tax=Colocasia esculenta TaxID=4460 RepID=A0A843WA85_COLES|nr:hypothetical protein [Colocasia esculenta]